MSASRLQPEDVIAHANNEHRPIVTWCLFSGGHDSTVLAHRCREHYQALVWIDTGTTVPGVAEFVTEYAQWLHKPLRVLSAGDAFRRMVLSDLVWWARYIAAHDRQPGISIEQFIAHDRRRHGRASGGALGQCPYGFPGPAAHGRAYDQLKERQLAASKAIHAAPGCCTYPGSDEPSRAAAPGTQLFTGLKAAQACSLPR